MEIDLDNKLREIPSSQPIFLSNNDYSYKPSNTRDEFPFEVPSSTKATFLNNQDFHHFENDPQFHPDWSSPNPISGVQTGSNFDSFDAFPYGSISTNMDFYDYDIKPFGDINHHHHQVILDNFQIGGGYLNLPITPHRNQPTEMVGSNQGIINNHQGDMFLNFKGVKPMNLVAPDELSCVTTNKDYYKSRVGMSKKITDGSSNNNRGMPSTKRTQGKKPKKNTTVKGQWTAEEDRLLVQLVEKHGIRKWSHIAPMLPGRIGKQCRERWHNHLRPNIKKDTWSEEEDRVLIQAHAELGNKWAEIAKRLSGRTENSIKNHWNATKRRQYSKRKCRSKYPRGSLLQDYIKSLNLDSPATTTITSTTITATERVQEEKASIVDNVNMGSTNSNTIVHSMVKAPSQHSNEMDFCLNDRLVPSFNDFNEVHDFDEKMFQEGFCNIDTLLDDDDMHRAPVFDETNFCVDDVPVEDVAPVFMDVEAKKKSS